jgi:hypothetical protein
VAGFYYVLQLRIVAAAAGVLGNVADAERFGGLARDAVTLLAAAEYTPVSAHGGDAGAGQQQQQHTPVMGYGYP